MLSEPEKIRVEFSKKGALKFISHLDLNRTVQAAFLRSRLPIWYTQGFNPHPKTVFSPPLSVGVSSECEFMDFKMTEDVPAEEVCEKLNASFPEGLRAVCAYKPESKFADIFWADYELIFDGGDANTAELVRGLFGGTLEIEKTTKIGTKTVDISPLVSLISCDFSGGQTVLRVLLSCDELNFVGPNLMIKCIADRVPALSDAECSICRKAVLCADKKTAFR